MGNSCFSQTKKDATNSDLIPVKRTDKSKLMQDQKEKLPAGPTDEEPKDRLVEVDHEALVLENSR